MNKNNQLNKKSFISLLLIIFTMTIHAENIIFSANSMNGKSNDKNSTTELKGNAYILTSSMEIKADSIVLFGEDYRFIKKRNYVTFI